MKKTVSGPFLSRSSNANSERTPLLSGEVNHVVAGGAVIENDTSQVNMYHRKYARFSFYSAVRARL